MSASSPLSESEQNDLLLEIYSLSRGFVRGKVKDQDVDDVVHDIATDCLVKLRTGRWTVVPSNLQAFVRELVKNHVINRRFKREVNEEHDGEHLRARELTHPEWVSPDNVDHEEYIAEFRSRVLAHASEPCRAAYYLVREQGLRYKEVAARLEVSPSTVHNYIVEANRLFRDECRILGIPVPARIAKGTAAASRWGATKAPFAPGYPPPSPQRCHPERSRCHPERSRCHPERSEGSAPPDPAPTVRARDHVGR